MVATRRVPSAPLTLFWCSARHRNGVVDSLRASRARYRVAPPTLPRIDRVARRHDGAGSLHFCVIRGCVSACASGAADVRLFRSSTRRGAGLLARLSRSHVGLRPPRGRTSLVSLVVISKMIRCIFASFAVASRRVTLAPSTFGCFAHHRDGVVDCSRDAALACRPAPPAPSRVSRLARRHDGDNSLHPRAIRGCILAYAYGAFGCFARSRRRGGLLARLLRSRVSSRLPRRRASLALLVVTTAMIRCILASFAVASRRVTMAPSIFGCFARHRDSDGGSLAHPSRSRVDLRLPRRYAPLAWLVVATAVVHCTLVISWLHFGVCLWRRRCSVASLAIATAWWAARAPLAPACRLTPPAPSHVPRVACRH